MRAIIIHEDACELFSHSHCLASNIIEQYKLFELHARMWRIYEGFDLYHLKSLSRKLILVNAQLLKNLAGK